MLSFSQSLVVGFMKLSVESAAGVAEPLFRLSIQNFVRSPFEAARIRNMLVAQKEENYVW